MVLDQSCVLLLQIYMCVSSVRAEHKERDCSRSIKKSEVKKGPLQMMYTIAITFLQAPKSLPFKHMSQPRLGLLLI